MSLNQDEEIRLIYQNEPTLKELFGLVLVLDLFYIWLLSVIMTFIEPNFLKDTTLTIIYTIIALIIIIGNAVGAYRIIYDDISEVIMTHDEIIFINLFDKEANRFNKIELNLIRKGNHNTTIEICTIDVSRRISLIKYEKDKEKLTVMGERIMEFCNKHYPNATYSKLFNEKNPYIISSKERTGTKI
ncbi:MAG: hypothetical protein ACTSYA_01505 [Candidatus Kariarchaeaceae archaeon]